MSSTPKSHKPYIYLAKFRQICKIKIPKTYVEHDRK